MNRPPEMRQDAPKSCHNLATMAGVVVFDFAASTYAMPHCRKSANSFQNKGYQKQEMLLSLTYK
jgi:hypothetical protein